MISLTWGHHPEGCFSLAGFGPNGDNGRVVSESEESFLIYARCFAPLSMTPKYYLIFQRLYTDFHTRSNFLFVGIELCMDVHASLFIQPQRARQVFGVHA